MNPKKGQFKPVIASPGESTPLVSRGDRMALNEFVKAAPTAYGPNGAAARESIARIGKASGGIKRGTQMYRALSGTDLSSVSGMKPGDSYTLDSPRSVTSAAGLADVGKFAKEGGTGAAPRNAVAEIEAMHDISGISRVNQFLHASRPGQVEGLDSEGLIGHGTRLQLREHTPGLDGSPDVYRFQAYNPEKD